MKDPDWLTEQDERAELIDAAAKHVDAVSDRPRRREESTELEPGRYRARAVSGVRRVAKSTGNPFVVVCFDLEDEPGWTEWLGFLSEKTAKRTAETLTLCGWPKGMDPSAIESCRPEAAPVVELDVQEDTYQGVTRTRVRWVNSLARRGGGR